MSDFSFCTIPPKGWECTRKEGHTGPCAAVPSAVVEEYMGALKADDEARIEAAWQKHKDAMPPQPTITTLTARIAALEVERDAAVARAEAAEARGRKLFAENVMLRNVKQAEAEVRGEARATAAIVAWLRSRGDCWTTDNEVADIFERGDHLKAPK